MKIINKQIHVIIRGRVIGVSYRAWTKTQADSLGLFGFVKNVDNHVEAIFQGNERKINSMLRLLKLGPPAARVEKITIIPKENKELFNGFKIKK